MSVRQQKLAIQRRNSSSIQQQKNSKMPKSNQNDNLTKITVNVNDNGLLSPSGKTHDVQLIIKKNKITDETFLLNEFFKTIKTSNQCEDLNEPNTLINQKKLIDCLTMNKQNFITNNSDYCFNLQLKQNFHPICKLKITNLKENNAPVHYIGTKTILSKIVIDALRREGYNIKGKFMVGEKQLIESCSIGECCDQCGNYEIRFEPTQKKVAVKIKKVATKNNGT